MLAAATILWKRLKRGRMCQIWISKDLIQSRKSSDSGESTSVSYDLIKIQVWVTFDNRCRNRNQHKAFGDVKISLPNQTWIIRHSREVFDSVWCCMKNATCLCEGWRWETILWSELLFHLEPACAPERERCDFGNLPSGHWCVCWVKSWIFRVKITIAMSWKLGSKSISIIFGSRRKSALIFLIVSYLFLFKDTSLFTLATQPEWFVYFYKCAKIPAYVAVLICHCLSLAAGFTKFDDFRVYHLHDVMIPGIYTLTLFSSALSGLVCDGLSLPRLDYKSLPSILAFFLFPSLLDSSFWGNPL